MSEYIDSLEREIKKELGQEIFTPSANANVRDTIDTDERVIEEMRKATGMEYSDEQLAILRHRGNACIIACAGSGKTSVSTHLIAKRIKTGEISDTDKLIYTTYSKAGATEMKDRLTALLEQIGIKRNIQVRTLHSFFLQIIRMFGVSAEVISAKDRSKYIHEACKEAGYITKDDDLAIIDNLLSYQINSMLSDQGTIDCYVNTLEDLTLEQYTKIRNGYAYKKAAKGLIDYDDMQSYLYLWLVKFQKSSNTNEVTLSNQVRDYCQALWTDYYIDEAQDISKIQFAILKAMITKPEQPNKLVCNLVLIGDDDQCLVKGTEVLAENENKSINSIKKNDVVFTFEAGEKVGKSVVTNRSRHRVKTNICNIITEKGNNIKCTMEHKVFAKLPDNERRMGYVLLVTDGKRFGYEYVITKDIENYFNTIYSNYEDTIRGWVVNISYTSNELLDYINIIRKKFNLCCFEDSKGESLTVIKDKLTDFGADYDYPNLVVANNGYTLELTMKNEVGNENRYKLRVKHRGSININNKLIELIGTKVKWEDNEFINCGIAYLKDEETINELVKFLKRELEDIAIEYKANIGYKEYNIVPASSVVKEMSVPAVDNDYSIVSEKVISIRSEYYKGSVYDIEVKDTHNFVAGNIIVHNCIYEWRGSDPSIILSVGPMFDVKTFVLSTNYRCLSEVVDYATPGIKCNNGRYQKDMKANKSGGKVEIAISKKLDLKSLSDIALKQIEEWKRNGVNNSDIAVLSRNNFHLAILGNMLFKQGIYCYMSDEMKLTKSYMYKDIKILLEMCTLNFNHTNTSTILWKLCRFMKIHTARVIADFQNNSSLSIEDALGYICKNCMDRNVSFDKKLNVVESIGNKLKDIFRFHSNETKEDLVRVYEAISSKEREKSFYVLADMYKNNCMYLYNTRDKKRAITGLVDYIIDIMKEKGYDKTMEFLRVTEQFESGRAGVIGERVTLSTIHSAKGREWKNVIMFACDNISQPSLDSIKQMVEENAKSKDIRERINEERRLFYVGNTRAKEHLVAITYGVPSVFMLESLGLIDNIGNSDRCNDKVIEYALDERRIISEYGKDIENMIRNKESKFYHTLNNVNKA